MFVLDIQMQVAEVEVRGMVGLNALMRTITDVRPAWPAVAAAVRMAMAQNFATESSRGQRWAPLRTAYLLWKMKHHPGTKILELSGDLRRSLTDSGDVNAIQEETKDELYISSRVPYGRYHQTGTTRMDARPPIALTAAQRFRLGQAVHRTFFADLFKGFGPGSRPSVRRAMIGI